MNGFVEPEYISCGIRKYVIKLFQMLCAEESNMKIMAGFTVVLSIIGLIVSLHVSEKNTGYGVMLKLMLLVLSFFSGIFSILFLIMY